MGKCYLGTQSGTRDVATGCAPAHSNIGGGASDLTRTGSSTAATGKERNVCFRRRG